MKRVGTGFPSTFSCGRKIKIVVAEDEILTVDFIRKKSKDFESPKIFDRGRRISGGRSPKGTGFILLTTSEIYLTRSDIYIYIKMILGIFVGIPEVESVLKLNKQSIHFKKYIWTPEWPA